MKYAIVETSTDIYIREFKEVDSELTKASAEVSINAILKAENSKKHNPERVMNNGNLKTGDSNLTREDKCLVMLVSNGDYTLYRKGEKSIGDIMDKSLPAPEMHDCNNCKHRVFEPKK